MFDVDALLSECVGMLAEADSRRAVKGVLERAVSRPSEVADAMRPERAGITPLLRSDELTILNVVWAPHMVLHAHDHQMWAEIAMYSGAEHNSFFRTADDGLHPSGGKALRPGDVLMLGHDAVHSVENPTGEFAGAFHVYGGDFFATPRSEWDPDTGERRPFDVDAVLRRFEEENEKYTSA